MLRHRPVVKPQMDELGDIGRQDFVKESPDAGTRQQQRRRLARAALIDPVDDVQGAIDRDHHIGPETPAQLIDDTVAILSRIGCDDPGVVDDVAVGGIENVEALGELACDRAGVGDLGSVKRRTAHQQAPRAPACRSALDLASADRDCPSAAAYRY